jgi:hypothetical protein
MDLPQQITEPTCNKYTQYKPFKHKSNVRKSMTVGSFTQRLFTENSRLSSIRGNRCQVLLCNCQQFANFYHNARRKLAWDRTHNQRSKITSTTLFLEYHRSGLIVILEIYNDVTLRFVYMIKLLLKDLIQIKGILRLQTLAAHLSHFKHTSLVCIMFYKLLWIN